MFQFAQNVDFTHISLKKRYFFNDFILENRYFNQLRISRRSKRCLHSNELPIKKVLNYRPEANDEVDFFVVYPKMWLFWIFLHFQKKNALYRYTNRLSASISLNSVSFIVIIAAYVTGFSWFGNYIIILNELISQNKCL